MIIFVPILVTIIASFTLPIVRWVKFPYSEYGGWHIFQFYASYLIVGIVAILMALLAESLMPNFGRMVLILCFFFVPALLWDYFTRHTRILEENPTIEWFDWLYFKVAPHGFLLIWWGSFFVFVMYPPSMFGPLMAW